MVALLVPLMIRVLSVVLKSPAVSVSVLMAVMARVLVAPLFVPLGSVTGLAGAVGLVTLSGPVALLLSMTSLSLTVLTTLPAASRMLALSL